MALGIQDQKKKSFIRRIFTIERNAKKMDTGSDEIPEPHSDSDFVSLISSPVGGSMQSGNIQSLKVFVATWNVGGKSPDLILNSDDFLPIDNQSDIYVLGFQEIVPLNAGNVLVAEDSEPAAKWLGLINQTLNKSLRVPSRGSKSPSALGGPLFFQKPSLRKVCKTFRTESKRKLKSCNCTSELERKNSKDFCFRCQQSNISESDLSSDDDDDTPSTYISSEIPSACRTNQMKYSLIVGKQMVGIFITVWMRKELVQHVSHLRVSCIGRGILGWLGNKGCVSVSMLIHRTSFCFVCSHLASGEKEGDELRRNLDVIEILKNTQFPRICRTAYGWVPDKIREHDRVIWLGDLNYRISLSYSETLKLLEKYQWDKLFDKDQLKIERSAGRVFNGWNEGKIYFAPTYKYSYNSDTYFGETVERRNKRRTPAWCDRILWHGNGIRQLSYVRGESRHSDHRPVCATFWINVEITSTDQRRDLSELL
ncbi:type I inositol 1 4 5-trisphosphate 5-phosphatase CVP2-like isoform X1 [Tripterygium wilfordii]|uniref:Type I inositol 1 4 5-trisphosphate 5-phosphatase CVP2-like isoform X1 n=1 Tax=Tripterygium wilfordii TaxID=458696 RepID=A0A7J7C5D7_TRIWF|nr:type I inositol polyphosphate 5-phosphatase 10 [Tripterygium wilfordii]XP_038690769.1 type I inositol polyphosphate 5-phosphatase 10 [Tripterygium wilfordii]KAF5729359.1 type I inositol 1 4 5-trisphosphate 5-phosphatase CVP2-like isoform X1 [Tripterygium wilfordii]